MNANLMGFHLVERPTFTESDTPDSNQVQDHKRYLLHLRTLYSTPRLHIYKLDATRVRLLAPRGKVGRMGTELIALPGQPAPTHLHPKAPLPSDYTPTLVVIRPFAETVIVSFEDKSEGLTEFITEEDFDPGQAISTQRSKYFIVRDVEKASRSVIKRLDLFGLQTDLMDLLLKKKPLPPEPFSLLRLEYERQVTGVSHSNPVILPIVRSFDCSKIGHELLEKLLSFQDVLEFALPLICTVHYRKLPPRAFFASLSLQEFGQTHSLGGASSRGVGVYRLNSYQIKELINRGGEAVEIVELGHPQKW